MELMNYDDDDDWGGDGGSLAHEWFLPFFEALLGTGAPPRVISHRSFRHRALFRTRKFPQNVHMSSSPNLTRNTCLGGEKKNSCLYLLLQQNVFLLSLCPPASNLSVHFFSTKKQCIFGWFEMRQNWPINVQYYILINMSFQQASRYSWSGLAWFKKEAGRILFRNIFGLMDKNIYAQF